MGQMEACETVLHVLVYLTMHLIAPMSASPSSSHVRNPSNTAQIGSRSCSNCTIAGMLLIARVLSLLLRFMKAISTAISRSEPMCQENVFDLS
ncbi:hypothetical protein RB195_014053 [Necator americanus]|uniref:Secreted protein n=1 Tax=Necator americanus TaxID=51031 RepID=A0ABR1DYE2_NECAM